MTAVKGAAAIDATAQAVKKAGQAAQGGGGGFKNLGYGILMVSQALEDSQYGFSAIVNNIPGIVMAFGGTAGMAGAASIASIAINQLIKHWDSLAKVLGMAHIKTAAEEMEDLRKKTSLTADEAERLRRADALPGKVKEIQAGKTEEQQKTETEATKAIIETGPKEVAAGIARADAKGVAAGRASIVDTQDEAAVVNDKIEKLQHEIDDAKATAQRLVAGKVAGGAEAVVAAGDIQGRNSKEIERLKRDVLPDARKRTLDKLVAEGTLPGLFPGRLDQLHEMVKADPRSFGPKGAKLASDLEDALPSGRRKIRDEKQHKEDVADLSSQAQALDKEASAVEDDELAAGREQIKRAQKDLAEVMEKEAYDVAKLSSAEEDLRKAIDAQAKKQADVGERRESRLQGLASDQPFRMISAEDEDARRREMGKAKRDVHGQEMVDREALEKSANQRAKVAGQGIARHYRPQILAEFASGRDPDREGMTKRVEQDLNNSKNYTKDQAKDMAPRIVEEMLRATIGQVQERSTHDGVGNREAATRELAKSASEARKDRPMGGFTDLTSGYKRLQHIHDQKDPYQALIAAETRKTAEGIDKLYTEVLKRRGNNPPGLIGAP